MKKISRSTRLEALVAPLMNTEAFIPMMEVCFISFVFCLRQTSLWPCIFISVVWVLNFCVTWSGLIYVWFNLIYICFFVWFLFISNAFFVARLVMGDVAPTITLIILKFIYGSQQKLEDFELEC